MRIKKNGGRRAVILGLAVGLLGGGKVVSAQIPCGGYEVTAIIQAPKCPPFGYPPMFAWGLNEQGWVVGSFNSCVIGPEIPWRWTPEQGMQVIPMPAGTSESRPLDISGSRIVGYHFVSGDKFGAIGFLYDFETDQFTSLGTLPGGDWSEAYAINSKAQIVGFWQNSQVGPRHGFIFENGIMQSLGDDLRSPNSQANDINANSQVTGWMGSSPLTDARAFIWENGKVTELPPIPGGFTSQGVAINNYADIAGRGLLIDPRTDEVVARALVRINGDMIDLGTLRGFPKSFATAINDSKIVVGFAQSTFGRAFVWKEGRMIALNDLISPELDLDIRTAYGINEAGQIAAKAVDQFNDNVALLLTPITGPPGDLNGDCIVGAADLLILLASWGPCDDCGNCLADLNSDCVVGAADLLILLVNWG